MTARAIIQQLIPPILVKLIKSLLACRSSESQLREWEYVPEGWAYANFHPEVKGWNVTEVLETYSKKWPRFVSLVSGVGSLGVSHESDLTANDDINSHNTVISFAYALALAAHMRGTMSMLDWGGGIGHYYLLAKALLPQVRIEYHCKDVPLLAQYGAEVFPDQHFYSDEMCLERHYDFVLASTSLHYTEHWQGLLRGLARATGGYLYITRLPTIANAPSYVFIQRPYSYGYGTEYLGWALNREEFLQEANAQGMKLIREFVIGESPPIQNAPESCRYRGFLFRPSGLQGY